MVYGRNSNTTIPVFNHDINSLQKFFLIFANFIMSDATSYDKSNLSMNFAIRMHDCMIKYLGYTYEYGSSSCLKNVSESKMSECFG